MISLLQSIVTAISSLVQIVINAIAGLLTIITQIPSLIATITSYVSYMPSLFLPFFTASIALWVIYLVLGKEH